MSSRATRPSADGRARVMRGIKTCGADRREATSFRCVGTSLPTPPSVIPRPARLLAGRQGGDSRPTTVAIPPLPFPPKAGISVHRRSSADGLAFPFPGVYPERSERASSPPRPFSIALFSILYSLLLSPPLTIIPPCTRAARAAPTQSERAEKTPLAVERRPLAPPAGGDKSEPGPGLRPVLVSPVPARPVRPLAEWGEGPSHLSHDFQGGGGAAARLCPPVRPTGAVSPY